MTQATTNQSRPLQALLGPDRMEERFHDFKPALEAHEADAEANRCIDCFAAPCISACPTGINIPQFISRIANGNPKGAAKTILDSNILGLSCAQACPTEVLCEGACVYNNLNKKPIMIGKLQRFAVEYAYDRGIRFYEPGKATGRKVALIGAGPSSLACAHELRRQGHEAVIFEKTALPGGLNTQGIAPYKMKAGVSLREIEQVAAIGVRFEYGRELGKNLSVDELLKGFDAVFLGLGLGPDSRMDAPGSDLPQVRGAVDFIASLKTAKKSELEWIGKLPAALVVGGGNTALDACRELKGLGVKHVVVSYRRGEDDMSGYAHEFKWARQEGVDFWFHSLPVVFAELPESKRPGMPMSLVRAGLLKTAVDQQGNIKTLNEKRDVEVGLVLVATGQSKLEKLLSGVSGLVFDRGRIQTDPQTGRTGNAKIFAGGDLANGGKEVVNAVAEGKRAALAMHEVLTHG